MKSACIMQSKNKVLSPNKKSVLSSYRHGSHSLVAGGQEGAELWQTTCCETSASGKLKNEQVIVSLFSAVSAALHSSIDCSGLVPQSHQCLSLADITLLLPTLCCYSLSLAFCDP